MPHAVCAPDKVAVVDDDRRRWTAMSVRERMICVHSVDGEVPGRFPDHVSVNATQTHEAKP